jgi:hypothetical protein
LPTTEPGQFRRTAVDVNKQRLGPASKHIHWLVADITKTKLESCAYDLWHDRAVFHFLTAPEERLAYVRQVANAVKPGGHVIVSTFGPEGPSKCSGLDVVRCDAKSLHREFGVRFRLLGHSKELQPSASRCVADSRLHPIDHEARHSVEEFPEDLLGLCRQRSFPKGTIHQENPPVAGSLIYMERRMPRAESWMASLFDVSLRPSEPADQEISEALLGTWKIRRRVHGPQKVVLGNLSIESGDQACETFRANHRINFEFLHFPSSPYRNVPLLVLHEGVEHGGWRMFAHGSRLRRDDFLSSFFDLAEIKLQE